MPHDLTGLEVVAGYAAHSGREGDSVSVIMSDFVTSDEGERFVQIAEGSVTPLLTRLGVGWGPSRTDHLLALLRRDGSATVFINELNLRITMVPKRDIKAGEAVTSNDIRDILELWPDGISEIPEDVGVVFLFSHGWRRGLFFDYTPINRNPDAGGYPRRELKLSEAFGYFYKLIAFPHLYSVSEREWESLLEQGWFPFTALRDETVRAMLASVREGLSIDERDLPKAARDLGESLTNAVDLWKSIPAFAPHLLPLERAAERYREGDFISVTSIVYPRIEGLLRTFHSTAHDDHPTQKVLAASLPEFFARRRPGSLLLPERFRRYLEDVYFAKFDPAEPIGVSRNTVGHGVAPQEALDLKAATIGLLVVEQLASLLAPIAGMLGGPLEEPSGD